MEYQWHAVYTKSRWEKKVAEQLSKLDIENYCPLNKVVRQWSDRKKTVEEPLFKSYVFVKISNKELAKIRQVLGVVNFVYWLGRPAIIPAKEINIIKEFLNNYVNVRLEPLLLNVQDPVKIVNGPFADFEGNVISIGKRSVRVSLPSLRYFMTTEVEIDNVKKITKQGQMIQRIAI